MNDNATPARTMPAYVVKTRNTHASSENRMHSDDVAASYGFKGALVPGVAVFSHMTQPLVAHHGAAWLSRAIAEVSFSKPAYDGDLLRIALESSPDVVGDNGVNIASPEAIAYAKYHTIYGLPANGLGAKFFSQGKEFVVTGLSPNRPKFPVNAMCLTDGKSYKFGQSVAAKVVAAVGGAA